MQCDHALSTSVDLVDQQKLGGGRGIQVGCFYAMQAEACCITLICAWMVMKPCIMMAPTFAVIGTLFVANGPRFQDRLLCLNSQKVHPGRVVHGYLFLEPLVSLLHACSDWLRVCSNHTLSGFHLGISSRNFV